MKKLILISAIVLSSITGFAQDSSYNLSLNFDNSINAILNIEDIGNRSYITLITDDVARMQVLRWENKENMVVYYLKNITIYINAKTNRFTISYGSTNLNGNWKFIE
jgi:hypothetical protein